MLAQGKEKHYVSKLINQPLLKKFDKGGWKQMISKSSFPKVTLQYKQIQNLNILKIYNPPFKKEVFTIKWRIDMKK